MPEVGRLTAALVVDASKFNAGLTSAQGKIGDFEAKAGQGFGNVAKIIAGVGLAVGAMAVGVGIGLFKLGQSFDEAYDTIQVGTGATGKALEGLQDDFRAIMKEVPAGMGDVSQAVADLNTRLNLTGKPLQQLSKQMVEMSRMTKTDLSRNIETTTRVFGDWAVSIEDQSLALDKLFRISQKTGPPVEEIGRLMVQYGAPLRQMGFNFNQAAALMGKFQKEGVNTELVMGSMRIGLVKLAKEGEDIPTAFRRIVSQIENMGSAAKANALAVEIFGARAGPDMAAAIREGRFGIDELLESFEGAEGSILDTARATEDVGEKFARLKNRVMLAVEPMARSVFDFAGVMMDKLAPALEWVAGVAQTALSGNLAGAMDDVWKMIKETTPKIIGPLP